MTRQNKLIILIAYLVLLCIVMAFYKRNRAQKIKLLHTEISRVEADRMNRRVADNEAARLENQIPSSLDITTFMEELFRCAGESGLKEHEITTEPGGGVGPARPSAGTPTSVVSQRLRVSISGSYRSVAEYIRLVQNLKRLNRISEFKLSSDNGQTIGLITIELYALPVKHAK